MLNLFKSDLKRIYKDTLFKVAIIVGLGFALFMPLTYFGMSALVGEDIVNAKTIFFSSMIPSSNFTLIAPVFIIIAICKDFSQGTVRNKIISGNSRSRIFFSLFLTCFFYLFAIILAHALITLILSLIFFDYQRGGFDGSDLGYLLLSIFFEMIVYFFISAIASFICVFAKNAGLSIVLYIAVTFGFSLIGSIIQIAYTVMLTLETTGASLNVLEFLTNTNPFLSALIGTGTTYSLSDILYIIIPPVLFGSLFLFLGAHVFNKKDLK